MLGRSALLAATNSENYGNWLGNYSDVSLLLRNGTPQLVPFDESPIATRKTITAVGNASVTTAVARWNQGSGGSSLAFDGSGDCFTVPDSEDFTLGSGDFTIELWARWNTSVSGAGYFLTAQANAAFDGNCSWALLRHDNNSLRFITTSSGSVNSGLVILDSPTAFLPVVNTWYHIVAVRSSGTVRLFIDAQLVASGSNSTTFFNAPRPIAVGGSSLGEASINGYIDDFRITKGVARYVEGTGANAGKMVFAGTNNFADPNAFGEFPANITDDPSYNSVSLLLRNGTPQLVPFDESPIATRKTITVNGTAGVTTTIFKWGTSALFGGTAPSYAWAGSNLTTSPSADFAYGTGDYTVEAWLYPTGNGSTQFNQGFLFFSQLTSGINYFLCGYMPDGVGGIQFSHVWATSGEGVATTAKSPAVSKNQWYHVAIVRSNGIVRVYANGISGSPVASSQNFTNTSYIPTIGGNTAGVSAFEGIIDDLRITKGVARYTSNFTPPPAELPNF